MRRPKITSVNHFNLFPVNHGGKMVIRDTYQALSSYFDISQVYLYWFDDGIEYMEKLSLNEHFDVYSVRLEPTPQESIKIPPQLIMSKFAHTQRSVIERLRNIANDSDIIIVEHVYTYRLIKAICSDSLICYRSHNVEYDYLPSAVKKERNYNDFSDELFELEKECCIGSDFIFTITEEDKERLCELYGVSPQKILNISSGVYLDEKKFILPSNRNYYKSPMAFYIGSMAATAIDSAKAIVNVAKEMPDVNFIIAGAAGNSISNAELSQNVKITGTISDSEKEFYLQNANVACNLMQGGSGLNVKMLEYFAYGIPVIATEFGSRGMKLVNDVHCVITKIENIQLSINKFLALPIENRDNMALEAFEYVKSHHSWESIVLKIMNFLNDKYPEHFSSLRGMKTMPTKLCSAKDNPYLPKRDYLIWGSGAFGQVCLKQLQSAEVCEPLGFIDSNPKKQGMYINGFKIYSPENGLETFRNKLIIVAVLASRNIIKSLCNKGVELRNIAIYINGYGLVSLSDSRSSPFYVNYDKTVDLTKG